MPEPEAENKRRKINLTTSQVAASALAASCAALVSSTLGVAGTLIGAAVASVVTTTGAALYSHLFHTGGKKIASTINSVGAVIPYNPRAIQTKAHDGTDADEAADAAQARTIASEPFAAETAPALLIPADRLYGATAGATADAPTADQSPGLWTPRQPNPADATAALEPLREAQEPTLAPERVPARESGRAARLRKPMALAVAIAAVFGVSVAIGMIAGQPIRQATGSPGPSAPHSTAPQTPASGSSGSASGAASSSPSAASPSATPDASTASPSGGASTSSGGSGSSPGATSNGAAGDAAGGAAGMAASTSPVG